MWNKVLTISTTVLFTVFLILSSMVMVFAKTAKSYDLNMGWLEGDASSNIMLTEKLSDEKLESVKEEMKKVYEVERIDKVYFDTYKMAKSNKKDVFVYGADNFTFNAVLSRFLVDVNIKEDVTDKFPVCVLDDGKYEIGDDYSFAIDGKEYNGYVGGFISEKIFMPFISNITVEDIIIMSQCSVIVPIGVLFSDVSDFNYGFYGVSYNDMKYNTDYTKIYPKNFYSNLGLQYDLNYNYNGVQFPFFYVTDSYNYNFDVKVFYVLLAFAFAIYLAFSVIIEWRNTQKSLLIKYSISTLMLLVSYIVMQIVISTSQFFTVKTAGIAIFGTLIAINLALCCIQLLIKKLSITKNKTLKRRFEDE